MRYLCLFSLFVFFSQQLAAQSTVGLVAYYTFSGNASDVTGNSANTGVLEGMPGYVCGISGDAIRFNGASSFMRVLSGMNVTREFDTEDFSISFYFKPVGTAGIQYLVAKQDPDCSDGANEFFIRYVPASRTINCQLFEPPNKITSLVYTIDNTACWQQITLVRANTRVRLYHNGEQVAEGGNTSRIDLSNGGDLLVGSGECLDNSEVGFDGIIDDLRIYNRALTPVEAAGLYGRPDQIVNPDTLLFLGSGIQINATNSCASTFSWTPIDDVSDPAVQEPVITPSTPGIFFYTLSMADPVSGCTALDSIRLNVVDPATLDCEGVFLPNAFSPNDDGLNDRYGISNPFVVQELLGFEIYDRWGGRVFYTENPFDTWDGFVDGKPVNPGVFLYRIRHVCREVERLLTGSLTVLR